MLRWINAGKYKAEPEQKPTAHREVNPELLPANLAGHILELEYESETSLISPELIAKLTCLYVVSMSRCSKQWSTTKYRTTIATKCTSSAKNSS